MRTAPRFGALVLTAGLVFAACGGDDDSTTNADQPPVAQMPDSDGTTTTHDGMDTNHGAALTASDLRATLEFVLQEHVYLAGAATGEAIGGRTAGFDAAAAALDANSNDITAAITTLYGDDAGAAFDPLWKKHIGFFVDYTTGIATGDQATADQAIADLTAYAEEFGAFLESATEGALPKEAVADLLGVHAQSLIAAIDAQQAGDATAAFANLKEAAGHMTMIAAPLAAAIDGQLELEGDTDSEASELRAALNRNLQEHVYLAGAATGEAIGGRTAGFDAAAAALDASSNDLVAAVTSVYGDDAGAAFDPLWKKHIGFFVDYTTGIATGDQATADQAIADLTAYAEEFGAFLESATEGALPKDAVADLLGEHATTLVAAIDAQQAGDATAAFANLKEAAGHMPMIADALAAAIATQMNLP